jgi:hypothetical protein
MKQKIFGKILLSIAPIFGVTGFYPSNKCKTCNAERGAACITDLKNENAADKKNKNGCQQKIA